MESQQVTNPVQLLRRKQAGEYLLRRYGFGAAATLSKIACVSSEGPPFRKCGRIVLYDPADLDVWASRKLSAPRRSTSETDASPSVNGIRSVSSKPSEHCRATADTNSGK
jgi:hypothetical protein